MESKRKDNVASHPISKDGPQAVDEEVRNVSQIRNEKIKAMLLDALDQPHPTTAGLGIVNSDLISLASRLKDAIDEACASWSDPVERLRELLPALREYLRITGQIAGYTELLREMNGVRMSIETLPSRPK